MKREKEKVPDAPKVTKEQIAELKQRLVAVRHEPLQPSGAKARCPECGGEAVATNDLRWVTATPGTVFVIMQLPGTRCSSCGSVGFDAAALLAAEAEVPNRILADYETAVTRTSGKTMGTYLKMDLARVLNLKGRERMFWKVLDNDRALVEIRRNREPETVHHRAMRGRPRHAGSSRSAAELDAEVQT